MLYITNETHFLSCLYYLSSIRYNVFIYNIASFLSMYKHGHQRIDVSLLFCLFCLFFLC